MCNDKHVWKLLNFKILTGTISMKALLHEDRVHNERFKNGFDDFFIPFHGHKMATSLAISVDKSS